MLDNWTEALETGGQIDTNYTDYEKAFDKVPHKRLVKKIASFGLPQQTVRWMKAFLNARQYRVKVNSKYLNWYQVKSGIPQGSVLCPLMFIMFINDITEVCSNNEADIYLFADDAKLRRHIVHESDYELLQTAVSRGGFKGGPSRLRPPLWATDRRSQ